MRELYEASRHLTVLTVFVAALAIYHLATGAVALLAPRSAARLVGAFYGATLGDSPQLRYATSMIGALALAVGIVAASAAPDPLAHRPIIAALLVLQLARLGCRLRDRRLLLAAFGVTPRRNAVMVAVLSLEVLIFAFALR